MSRRYDVDFRDACLILQGYNICWNSLLIFVSCVMDECSRTIVVTNICIYFFLIFLCGNMIEVLFSLECLYTVLCGCFSSYYWIFFLFCRSIWTVICIFTICKLSFFTDNMIPVASLPVVAIAAPNGPDTVDASPPIHPATQRDPVSKALYFYEY
jgi:hypothetical protein